MTQVERHLTEHLQAHAGTVTVTYHDLEAAHRELHDRLGDRARRRTSTAAVAVAASVLLIICAVALRNGTDRSSPGPALTSPSTVTPHAPDGRAPTAQLLLGIWRQLDDPGVLLRFGADGTYSMDDGGHLDTYGANHGTYRVQGRTITFATLGGYACPTVGPPPSLAGLPDDGRLTLVALTAKRGGGCDTVVGQRSTFTRVSPQSPAGAALTVHSAAGQLITATTESRLYGIWLHQGTGRLLHIAADGTYAVDDSGELATVPDDTGRFAVDGRGRLRLTSTGRSRECAPGDRSSWSPVRVSSTAMTVTIVGDACQARANLAGSWLRLS